LHWGPFRGVLRPAAICRGKDHQRDPPTVPNLPILDIVAFLWFLGCAYGYGFVTRRGSLAGQGIIAASQRRRNQWMENMLRRENRIFDIQILSALSNANTFFASTSVIIAGGLAALLGSGGKLRAMIEDWPYVEHASPLLWQLKTLFLLSLFVIAFFKFAWGYRLSHYTALMIGAMPMPCEDGEPTPQCLAHAAQTAKLAGNAAEHANTGMRTFYFAIAGIAWYLHPILFMVASLWVVLVIYRREYLSNALDVIGDD